MRRLTAIAEEMPSDDRSALALIPGVGQRKLSLYGDALLALLAGADPSAAAAEITKSRSIQ
jgi:DNA helicase-2/ATP-dependent DNA helicase PcrA